MEEKIKLHILHLGDTSVDITNIFPPEKKPLNPIAWTGLFRSRKYQVRIPVTSYLIEHPKGKIVIDTGFHSAVRTNALKELNFCNNTVNKPLQKPGDAIDEVLAARGLKPSDLDYVVLSHLHSDHADGVRLLKGAKNIVVSRPEMDNAIAAQTGGFVAKMSFCPRWWDGTGLKPFDLTPSDIGPVGESWDVFGDGTVVFFRLPGHTPGMVGTRIANNGKYIILTADCGYSHRSWEEMIIPSVVSDREGFTKSLQWLKKQSEDPDCIAVLANHETELATREYEI